MQAGKGPFSDFAEREPADLLEALIGIFTRRGWMNQSLRIKHHARKYQIFCCQTEFSAYRINENCGVSPGFPGWPVCRVTRERIMEDSRRSPFPSGEPTVDDWVRCLAEADFETI